MRALHLTTAIEAGQYVILARSLYAGNILLVVLQSRRPVLVSIPQDVIELNSFHDTHNNVLEITAAGSYKVPKLIPLPDPEAWRLREHMHQTSATR